MATTKTTNYLIPESRRFNGHNLTSFKGTFTLLLHERNMRYLADSSIPQPAGANVADDKFVMYELLVMNVNDTAANIISKHSPDGKAAWSALLAHYSETNIQTVKALLREHGTMKWTGGSRDEFDTWVSEFQNVTNKLAEAKLSYEDWQLAAMLLSKVPEEYTTGNIAVDLTTPDKIKYDAVVEQIRSRIRIDADVLALFTRGNRRDGSSANKNKAKDDSKRDRSDKPKRCCTICKDILMVEEKYYGSHNADTCFQKDKFSSLLSRIQDPHTKTSLLSRISTPKIQSTESANMVIEDSIIDRIETIDETWDEDECLIITTGEMAFAVNDDSLGGITWVVDSGCTINIVKDDKLLNNYELMEGKFVAVADGRKLWAKGKGTFTFAGEDGKSWKMSNVYHVPHITHNLFSVRRFTRNKGKVLFEDEGGKIFNRYGDTIATMSSHGSLYRTILPGADGTSMPQPHVALMADSVLTHRRYGHVGLHDGQDGLPDVKVECEPCMLAKFRRLPFNGTTPLITVPLEHINVDLFGPLKIHTWSGCRYLLVVTDAATKYTRCYLQKTKDQSFDSLMEFITSVEKQTSYEVKNVTIDGGELMSKQMEDYCRKRGIGFHPNAPHTSNQNARAERRIGIIISDARVLLMDSGLSGSFWGYAATHAVFIRNRIAPKDGQSPYEQLFGKKPSRRHLHPFGCAAYRWIPPANREDGKLNARSHLTVYVGCEDGTSNFRLFSLNHEKAYRSRDVRFVESHFPGHGAKHDLDWLDGQWEKKKVTFAETKQDEDTWSAEISNNNHPVRRQRQRYVPPPREEPHQTRRQARIEAVERESTTDPSDATTSPEPESVIPQGTVIHPQVPITHGDDSDTSEDPLALAVTTLTTKEAREAFEGPDAERWLESRRKEVDIIESAGTWKLINRKDLPVGAKPIDSRFVHTIKHDPSGGGNDIYKTRLVAKGFTQRPGIDFVDTYSPVGHRQSFRQVMTISAHEDFEIEAIDITGAFLHGDLDHVVYMNLPPELAVGEYEGKVALLIHSLYGLKQAGLCWNAKLDTWLRDQGWKANKDDPCVYIRHDSTGAIELMLYIHVDDAAIAGRNKAMIHDFIAQVNQRFPCRAQGELVYFLSMEIHRDRPNRRMWITQQQYTSRVLERFNLSECNPSVIPIPTSAHIDLRAASDADHAAASHLPYRMLTGSLQYLATMTRPDIAYAVNKMSSYNSKWSERHYELCKTILRYVAGTRSYGLRMGGSDETLKGICDADYAGCKDTRRSTTGWIVQYRGGTIAWNSKKQSVVAHSTAEAEYIAMDSLVRDLVWERRCLDTLGDMNSIRHPTQMFSDNRSAISLAKNRTNHDSTKHIDVKYHYIRDKLQDKSVQLSYVPTSANPADIFTKLLPREIFQQHVSTLGIEPPSA